MVEPDSRKKSPILLLAALTVLVISTLVVASLYFIRPGLESRLSRQATDKLKQADINTAEVKVSGRDALLTDQVKSIESPRKAEQITRETCGIRFFDNQLLVKNRTIE